MGDAPTVAFLVDEPRWAFDRWTAALVAELHRAGVCSTRYFRETLPKRVEEDYICVCWWPDVDVVVSRLAPTQIILCRVADMVTWNRHAPAKWRARFQQLIPSVHTYVASSREIELELRDLGVRNVIRLGDCVDAARFCGKRFNPVAKPTIGWCGNPKALEWMGFADVKGFSVVESLRSCSEVTLKVAVDLPAEQMPQWYKCIDIYVCASRFEGTPLPVLEAMATGNIVISTMVGIVPELGSPGVLPFDGTSSGLHAAIAAAISMRSQWAQLGAMNRQCIVERWSSTAAATALSMWLSSLTRPLSEEVERVLR